MHLRLGITFTGTLLSVQQHMAPCHILLRAHTVKCLIPATLRASIGMKHADMYLPFLVSSGVRPSFSPAHDQRALYRNGAAAEAEQANTNDMVEERTDEAYGKVNRVCSFCPDSV